MSFGNCEHCGNNISTEEYNAGIEIRPNSKMPVLCFACTGTALETCQARIAELEAENEKLTGFIPAFVSGSQTDRIAELEAELEKYRWIPVEERLPEDKMSNFLTTNGETVSCSYYSNMNPERIFEFPE